MVLNETQGQICLSLSSLYTLHFVYRDVEISHSLLVGARMKSVIPEHFVREIFLFVVLKTAFTGHKIFVLKQRCLSGIGGGGGIRGISDLT
jgi:hypothetical protein